MINLTIYHVFKKKINNELKRHNLYYLDYDYYNVIYFDSQRKILNASNNICTTIFFFIYDRSINGWIDKKYKTNLFVLCSGGRRLKIGFLDKEL